MPKIDELAQNQLFIVDNYRPSYQTVQYYHSNKPLLSW